MTDEELIARLQDEHVAASRTEAADRIEALIAERDDAEAKLAKAVEALGRIARQPDYRLPSPQEIARAALARVKGVM